MADAADDILSGDSVRDLIEAAERDAAALGIEPETDVLPNDAVPGFEIVNELGRGGMGVVYRAIQLSTKRTVALKVMLAGCFASPIARKRFQREIEFTARLQHQGIVRVLESGQTATGQPYYAMDYVDGVSLDNWRIRASPDQRGILCLFAGICDALENAHQHGVIHRDLKPANVLVDEQDKPHILDFGLAKAVDVAAEASAGAQVSVPGQVVGTLRYLSPEQTESGVAEVDARTDVHGVGLMLYETLTGALPFDPMGSPYEIMQRIREVPPQRPSTLSNRVNRELETIVLKSIDKDKARRYQSAGELAADLRRFLAGEPIAASPPSSLYVFRKRLIKHRLRIAFVVAAAVLSLLGLWGGAWWRERSQANARARERAATREVVLDLHSTVEAGTAPLEEVLARAETIVTQFPDLPEARLTWSQIRFRLGRERNDDQLLNGAIASLRNSMRQYPGKWAYESLLSEMLDAVGTHESRQQAAVDDTPMPETAEAWYLLSFATLEPEKAIVYGEEARRLDPSFALARERLAYLYGQTFDVDAMRREVQKLVELGHDPAEWTVREACTLIRARRYEEAIEACTRAINLRPGWEWAHRHRALAHQCLGNHRAAIDDYTRAVGGPGAAVPWEFYYRATSFWALGRWEEAAADYRAVAEMQSAISFAHARLFLLLRDQARTRAAAGERAEADQLLSQAERLQRTLRERVSSPWLAAILDCLTGELPPGKLVQRAETGSPAQLCEACYYAGEACLLNNHQDEARKWFERCVGTNLVLDPGPTELAPMCEYHLACWRLGQLGDQAHPAIQSIGP